MKLLADTHVLLRCSSAAECRSFTPALPPRCGFGRCLAPPHPFDRLLIAHAMEDGYTIVSHDDFFGDYNVPLLLA